MNINRIDVTVLEILSKENCNNAVTGMTINEINSYYEGTQVACRMQLFRRMTRLLELGFIKKGILDNKANTYYITPDGLKILEGEVVVNA